MTLFFVGISSSTCVLVGYNLCIYWVELEIPVYFHFVFLRYRGISFGKKFPVGLWRCFCCHFQLRQSTSISQSLIFTQLK